MLQVATYNDAISALQDEYDNKSYWVNQWNNDNSIATVSEKDQWIQDRDDALELRTQIINDGEANFHLHRLRLHRLT